MPKSLRAPRGTADILPDEVVSWQTIEKVARDMFKLYGFREIRTPLFEESALFKRSLGQTSDVVNKQLLELKKAQSQTEGDEASSRSEYALRPEGTASIARTYIEHSLDKKENVSKLFYIGPMFRGERPQKGRLRQFHQIGVEVIGPQTASPYLDSEVISLSVELLKAFGLKDYTLKLNTLGSSEDKEQFSKFLRSELKNKISSLCEDCQKRFEQNVFRILDCKKEQCKKIINSLNLNSSYLSPESAAYFMKVREALDELGIKYEWSPKLVRGLDYYTHTVFEVSHPGLGSQDALGAGGRYNNLVSDLGGPQVDAIGFAMGMERALLAMPAGQKPPEQSLAVFIVPLDENAVKRGFNLINRLRLSGISGTMNYKLSSVKSQMRSADKSGARYVIILGEEEEKSQTVMLKDMRLGEQQPVSVVNGSTEELIRMIKK